MRFDITLLYLFLRLLGKLPLRTLHGIGAGIGRFSLWLHSRTAQNTAVNLRIARPQWGEQEHAALLRKVMMESGKSATEIAGIWGNDAERALDLVREVRGEALFDAALASGKGVIIAAPHLGCWELL